MQFKEFVSQNIR